MLRRHKELWLPFAFLRSSEAKKVQGGWQAISNKLVDMMIMDSGITDTGVVIQLQDERPRIIFIEIHSIIGDMPALASFMGIKGYNANVPCPLMCSNLTSQASGLAEHNAALVDTTCSDRSSIVRTTNDQVWGVMDLLEEGRRTLLVTHFKQREVATGNNFLPSGLLANRNLRRFIRPAEMTAYDPMHVLVSNGIVNFELYYLFSACGWNWCYDSLRALAEADWRLPCNRRRCQLTSPIQMIEAGRRL